jgi:hypothetical protein
MLVLRIPIEERVASDSTRRALVLHSLFCFRGGMVGAFRGLQGCPDRGGRNPRRRGTGHPKRSAQSPERQGYGERGAPLRPAGSWVGSPPGDLAGVSPVRTSGIPET